MAHARDYISNPGADGAALLEDMESGLATAGVRQPFCCAKRAEPRV